MERDLLKYFAMGVFQGSSGVTLGPRSIPKYPSATSFFMSFQAGMFSRSQALFDAELRSVSEGASNGGDGALGAHDLEVGN
eukprot:6274120-Pyramimonas_sp.AAC.1